MPLISFLFDHSSFPTFMLLVLCSSSGPCSGVCSDNDRDSLSLFNLSVSAAPPLNWTLSVDCCSWEGVGCDGSGRVTTLSLPSRGLTGQIPPYVANLTGLMQLNLSHNNLIGMVPRGIGRLYSLEQLRLHSNMLIGILPRSLANCTKLTALNLRFNSLEGELSAFDFSKRVIDLGFNLFDGALPVSLFSCTTIRAIRLSFNHLGGEIPPNIVQLQLLSVLALAKINLSNIRRALRILERCKNLEILALLDNFYDEELPDSEILISPDGFQNLQIINLKGCRLTGTIPQWLSKLSNIGFLDLSQNSLSGSIPGWLGTLPNLFHLDLSSNALSGHFPLELTQLTGLPDSNDTSNQGKTKGFELPVVVPSSSSSLQYNRLSNPPPALRLANNILSGEIPAEVGRLTFLTILDLKHNNFSGHIPDTLYNLSKLQVLDLSGNRLSGEIPASLTVLHFLSEFNVAFNNLHGPIPTGHQFIPSSIIQVCEVELFSEPVGTALVSMKRGKGLVMKQKGLTG